MEIVKTEITLNIIIIIIVIKVSKVFLVPKIIRFDENLYIKFK